jgi:hypothetical protein
MRRHSGPPAGNAASQEGAMAGHNTKDSPIDFAHHRQEAAHLRELSMNCAITRSLRRLRPSPVVWNCVAALVAAGIGWMVIERPVHRPDHGGPGHGAVAPMSLPVPADLANATYDAN